MHNPNKNPASITRGSRRRSLAGIALLTGLISANLAVAYGQVVIPESYARPVSAADTSKPGFLWRYSQVDSVAGYSQNSNARTEAQLAGLLGPNTGDPNAAGAASGAGKAGAGPNDPIEFTVPDVINFDINAGSNGHFTPDAQMPGAPGVNGGTDNQAAEVIAWLNLDVGTYTIGVNSDDGFRLAIGGYDPHDRFAVVVGEFDGGRGAADTLMKFQITKAGLYPMRCIWENGGGGSNIEIFTAKADGSFVLLNDAANGGIKAYRAASGATVPRAINVVPAPGTTSAVPGLVQVDLTDAGTKVVAASVKLSVDGTATGATATKTGSTTSIKFVPSPLFLAASKHSATLVFSDDANTSFTNTWNFTVQNYATITPDMAATGVDKTKSGFRIRPYQVDGGQPNSLSWTEDELAGLKGPNIADLSGADKNGFYDVTDVINFDIGGGAGNFTNDKPFPGFPGTGGGTDNTALEAITYLEFPTAGVWTMGVNSDDGFRVTVAANPLDKAAVRLGQFDGGRGASDTIFTFVVQQAGIYPARLIWENGGGGANLEWFTVDSTGTKILVNDQATAGHINAYRVAAAGPAYVKSISPAPGAVDVGLGTSITAVLTDAGTTVDPAGVKLNFDGVDVKATATKTGTDTTVTFKPAADLLPATLHTNSLTFGGRKVTWTFTTGVLGTGTLFIEAEDFNFGHGQYIKDKPIGMTGKYAGGDYQDKGDGLGGADGDGSDFGIDYHEANNGNDQAVYRPNTAVEAGKLNEGGESNRGDFDVTVNHIVGWNDAGDWYNYTRVFPSPAKLYKVYGRFASGGAAIDAELDQVTSDPTKPNQTTKKLGEWKPGRATAGWDSFETFTMKSGDDDAVVRLGGELTLRLTTLPGNVDYDYLAFVPQPDVKLPPAIANVVPASGSTVAMDASIHVDINNGDTKVVLSTIKLTLNGTDITSKSTVTSTAGGASVVFVPATLYGLNVTNTLHVEFSDDGTPANKVSKDTSFVTSQTKDPLYDEKNLFIEAEDFNLNGDYLPSKNGVPFNARGLYNAKGGTVEIDYHNANQTDSDKYRKGEGPDVNVNMTEIPADGPRIGFDQVADFKVGWNDAGDWYNYTRTFPTPAKDYNVYARLSSGGNANAVELDQVTAGAKTANQTVSKVGVFKHKASGGWDTFLFVQLADDAGNSKTVNIGGETTFRVTILPDGNEDFQYLMFVPVGAQGPKINKITRQGANIVFDWDGTATLQSADNITGPWTDVVGATSPRTVTPSGARKFYRLKQ